MKYGFIITGGEAREQVELARAAEAAGWDGVFTWDGVHVRDDIETYDPWALMGAMAMATERVQLGAILTPPSRRRPWNLARQTTTVDRLSGGRLILGLGRGAGKVEFEPIDGHTKVKLAIDYDPPKGAAGEIGDKVVQATPRSVENDLKRFKEFIEHRPQPTGKWAGEIRSGQVKK